MNTDPDNAHDIKVADSIIESQPPPVLIPIGHGFNAIVDAEDAHWIKRFKWRVNFADGKPYAITSNDPIVKMHRMLMGFSEQILDHKDRNTLNNQKSNLRAATVSQNAANQKLSKRNKSGFKGVAITKSGKWQALLVVNYKSLYLGVYTDKIEAAKAYDIAATANFGQYAATNKILGLL